MAKRRLSVSLKKQPALRVSAISIGNEKLCYLLVADKKIKYANGRSRIVYIGTTKNGLTRISQSVAARAESVLSIHGVTEFKARVVTCQSRRRVKTWHKLERALLLEFKELYGVVPRCNTKGDKMTETDEFTYFSRSKIRMVIEDAG